MATFALRRPTGSVVQVSRDGEPPEMVAVAPAVPAVQGAAKARHAQAAYVGLAYALVAVGVVVGWRIDVARDPAPPVVVQGLSVFAALYVAAQVIERLIEPVTEWTGTALGGVEAPEIGAKDRAHKQKAKSKSEVRFLRDRAIRNAARAMDDPSDPDAAQRMANVAADAQVAVEQDRKNSTVLVWGLASMLGIVLAGWLGLAFMHSVGVKGAPRLLDIVVTGLAIGGGSKPLHDLISNLQASKDAKSDPPEVKSA